MLIKVFDWEISFRRETTGWAVEDREHIWEYIFRIEWLSPYEKKHRAMLAESRRKK